MKLRRVAREPGHRAAAGTPWPVGCAILTVSDTRRGLADTGGALIERLVIRAGHRVVVRGWVRDDRAAIRRAAQEALGRREVDVLVVSGGSGIAPRDVTPDAIEPLFERRLAGFGELFRVLSLGQVGAAAWLSRAAAGVVRGRLVVLLPGSRAAVSLAMKRLVLPELSHAVRMLGRHPREA